MIAEVAMTMKDIRFAAHGDLHEAVVATEVNAIHSELRSLAHGHPAPPNLAAYVQSVFEEMAS